jgi:hypothetical protein
VEAESTTRGRLGGALGLVSLASLAASLVWAHHWTLRADAIVLVWGLSTTGALVTSRRSLLRSEAARGWAWLGLWLAVLSVLALIVAGIAAAAGASMPGCGGG